MKLHKALMHSHFVENVVFEIRAEADENDYVKFYIDDGHGNRFKTRELLRAELISDDWEPVTDEHGNKREFTWME